MYVLGIFVFIWIDWVIWVINFGGSFKFFIVFFVNIVIFELGFVVLVYVDSLEGK